MRGRESTRAARCSEGDCKSSARFLKDHSVDIFHTSACDAHLQEQQLTRVSAGARHNKSAVCCTRATRNSWVGAKSFTPHSRG